MAVTLAALLAGAWLFATGAAEAGGSPLSFERSLADGEWYAPGELAVARGDLGPGCCDRGWLEDGPWSAEIVRYDDAGHTVGEPIAVGELRVEQVPYEYNARHLSRLEAVVEFVVPDVVRGSYVLNHCNDPCTTQLGSLTAGWFRIGPPPAPAPPEPVEAPPTPSAVPSTTQPASTTTTTVIGTKLVSQRAALPSSTSVALVAGAIIVVLVAAIAALVARRGRRR